MADHPKYDVAISFLGRDDPTAAPIASQLEQGLKVFYFPRQQEELAGTDGLESMRTPFLESRIVVVLFRSPWGGTEWTRIEETAIKDRCLSRGWDSLIFIMLDDSPPPVWLPRTHIRFDLKSYGIDQAVGAIKVRVQEQGGVIEKPSPLAQAKRVKAVGELRADQKRLVRDQSWIQKNVPPTIKELFEKIKSSLEEIRTETQLSLHAVSQGYRCILRGGVVSVDLGWRQHYTNVIEDVHLVAREYSALIYLPHEGMRYMTEPEEIARKNYLPTLDFSRELRWVDETRPNELLSNEDVAQRVLEQFLDLVDRDNRGALIRERDY